LLQVQKRLTNGNSEKKDGQIKQPDFKKFEKEGWNLAGKPYFCDPVAKTLNTEVISSTTLALSKMDPKPVAKGLDPDFLGVGGSFLCILHCLMPQFMAMGMVGLGAGAFLGGELWTLIFWVSCFFAVWQAGNKTVFPLVKWMLWFAFGIFSMAILGELVFHFEHWVSLSGSAVLIATHLFNLKKQNDWKRTLQAKVAA
jgi:hypothetical protein